MLYKLNITGEMLAMELLLVGIVRGYNTLVVNRAMSCGVAWQVESSPTDRSGSALFDPPDNKILVFPRSQSRIHMYKI
ncbi:hypothetical protein RRG08_012591 [Elysia crispata]|uniref:Uncharacterized protein n=1 Tax=Elysia crispata TaxID=231223 RepID=A0AAE1DZ68_9GAST|nr:hypothetical protein RRG08_012591 [Elysia crispata]